ncbi:hypothetical protein FRC17_007501, partial [Serendipita sp. 399]
MSFKKWADRSRLVLKSLLDSDYRLEYHQIEALRLRLAELERKNTAYAQEIELAQEEQRTLRERLVKQSQDHEQGCSHDAEIKRLMRQLEAQGKLLEETEGLLETLRTSDSKRRSQLVGEEKASYLEKIATLEERVAMLTKEGLEAGEEVRRLQGSQHALQQQLHIVEAEKQEVTGRLTDAEQREDQLRRDVEESTAKAFQETEERNAVCQTLTTEKQSLENEIRDLVLVSQDLEKQLQLARQELVAAQAQSYTTSILNHQLQGAIKALEGQKDAGKANGDSHVEQSQPVEELHAKVTELEKALETKTKENEEMASEMKAKYYTPSLTLEIFKIEEINRLNDIVEHGDFRAHKLKKPRHPSTPPGTIGHNRSSSISARLGFERERTLSGSKPNSAIFPTRGGSPSSSPSHRAQATLPIINSTGDPADENLLADTSGATEAASGSATL